MKIDFETVNITKEKDWELLHEEWETYFDGDYPFAPYRRLLSKMNVIVGFGRGFWSGVHNYYYLVYHKERKAYYWYLRNIESDLDVYFYELIDPQPFLELLKTKDIPSNFYLYDVETNYDTLGPLAVGRETNIPKTLKPVPIQEIFGEDTEPLRTALMLFNPGSHGTDYPHLVYHRDVFTPAYRLHLDEQATLYNKGEFYVERNDDTLDITLNGDVFKLKKLT